MPDKLSSEDYFALCVWDCSAEAQADTGIQMEANADRAIQPSCKREHSVLASQVKSGTITQSTYTNDIHQVYQ